MLFRCCVFACILVTLVRNQKKTMCAVKAFGSKMDWIGGVCGFAIEEICVRLYAVYGIRRMAVVFVFKEFITCTLYICLRLCRLFVCDVLLIWFSVAKGVLLLCAVMNLKTLFSVNYNIELLINL